MRSDALLRTTTTTALLEALNDPARDEIWGEFDRRYRPILQAFAVRLGLSHADAADAAQETLLQFVRDYRAGRYDRSRARLHSWIIGIAQNRVYDQLRRGARERAHREDLAERQLPDSQTLTAVWNEEYESAKLREALDQLRNRTRINPKTVEAFTRHVLRNEAPQRVADSLGVSVSAVYLAKHRCLGKLRELMAELDRVYM